MKTKRPKFQVGQVVMAKLEHRPVKLQKRTGEPFCKDGNMWAIGGKNDWYHELELRPLTARERGPRRPAARGGKS